MPEANAEGDTPCPDEPLARKQTRGTVAFAFGAARLALKGKARPSPVSAHSI